MNLLIIFILVNVANVILQTIRSLCTVKCGKMVAAIVNAITYAVYTFVIIFTTVDGIDIWTKALIVGVANFFGVYVVKAFEEKMRKTQLWKLEATFPIAYDGIIDDIKECFDGWGIPNNYIEVGPHVIFNCYCYTCEQTDHARMVVSDLDGKLFISESKISY